MAHYKIMGQDPYWMNFYGLMILTLIEVLAVGAEERVRGPELVHAPEGGTVLLAPPRRRRLVELDDGLEEPRPVGGRERRRRAPRAYEPKASYVGTRISRHQSASFAASASCAFLMQLSLSCGAKMRDSWSSSLIW